MFICHGFLRSFLALAFRSFLFAIFFFLLLLTLLLRSLVFFLLCCYPLLLGLLLVLTSNCLLVCFFLFVAGSFFLGNFLSVRLDSLFFLRLFDMLGCVTLFLHLFLVLRSLHLLPSLLLFFFCSHSFLFGFFLVFVCGR